MKKVRLVYVSNKGRQIKAQIKLWSYVTLIDASNKSWLKIVNVHAIILESFNLSRVKCLKHLKKQSVIEML